jgi:membrane glycosyltransferase
VRRANALQIELQAQDEVDSLRALHDDAELRAAHDQFLPHGARRQRGEIDPDRAVAEAKLNDAETIEDAIAWLKPKERFVVLHDRALIALLARLPHEAPLPQSVAAAG